MEQIEYTTFNTGEHLTGVLALCEAEGWKSFPGHPELTDTALRAPGVTTVVTVGAGKVIGFAQMQSDGREKWGAEGRPHLFGWGRRVL